MIIDIEEKMVIVGANMNDKNKTEYAIKKENISKLDKYVEKLNKEINKKEKDD